MNTVVVPVIINQPNSAPSKYQTFFETSEGISVEVIVKTHNKVIADTIEANMVQAMGWKIVDQPSTDANSRGEAAIFAGLSVLFGLGLFWILGMVAIIVGHMGAFYSFNESLDAMSMLVRMVVYAFAGAIVVVPATAAIMWKPVSTE